MMKINGVRANEAMESPPRRTRRFGPAGAVAVVLASSAVALAACGSSSSSINSAGSSASAASGGSSASAQTANSNKLEQFSQCMRAHGVPSFPDPVNGRLNLRVTKGGSLDPNSAAFKSAEQACKSLAPPGIADNGQPSPQTQSAQLKFVGCMHSHGVPNFPDPQANGAMIIKSGNGVDPNSPTFQSALKTCRNLLPGGTGLGG